MLQAQNMNVYGGQFTQVTASAGSGSGLALLTSHASLGSLLNSSERFDPPKCSEDTREAIIEDILSWINSGDQVAKVFWLFGPAGAGKSALAQSIAELCEAMGKHAGSAFFSRTASGERGDGDRLIPTLAIQLVESVPGFKSKLKRILKKNPTIFQQSRQLQMEKLLIEPLNAWSIQRLLSVLGLRVFPRLIVIDGLDECKDTKVQRDLIRIVCIAASRLQLPMRILIASRPEAHIVQAFSMPAFNDISLETIDLAKDYNIEASLRNFLKRSFADIRLNHPLKDTLQPSWPIQKDVEYLVKKSTPQFIFAATVVKYVAAHDDRPDDRLRVVLRMIKAPKDERPYADLDALYTYIFLCIQESKRTEAYAVLGLLHCSSASATYPHLQNMTSASKIELLLDLKMGDVKILLQPLLSLLHVPNVPTEPIKIFHASLFDFLADPSRSAHLQFSLLPMHKRLARGFARLALKDLAICFTDHNENLLATCQHFAFHRLKYREGVGIPPSQYDNEDNLLSAALLISPRGASQFLFHLCIVNAFAFHPRIHLEHLFATLPDSHRYLTVGCRCTHNSQWQESHRLLRPIEEIPFTGLSFGSDLAGWNRLDSYVASGLARALILCGTLVELDARNIHDFPASILAECKALRFLHLVSLQLDASNDQVPTKARRICLEKLCFYGPLPFGLVRWLLTSPLFDLSGLQTLGIYIPGQLRTTGHLELLPLFQVCKSTVSDLHLRSREWEEIDHEQIVASELLDIMQPRYLEVAITFRDEYAESLSNVAQILQRVACGPGRETIVNISLLFAVERKDQLSGFESFIVDTMALDYWLGSVISRHHFPDLQKLYISFQGLKLGKSIGWPRKTDFFQAQSDGVEIQYGDVQS